MRALRHHAVLDWSRHEVALIDNPSWHLTNTIRHDSFLT